jgi:hypothetical protein
LRLFIQGNDFKDKEWADHPEILALVQKLKLTVAIVDTRYPALGFVYYYIRTDGSLDHTNDEANLPKDNPIIKIAFTGDHYLSVLKHPELIRDSSTAAKERPILTSYKKYKAEEAAAEASEQRRQSNRSPSPNRHGSD